MQPYIGMKLGAYQIVEQVGQGGMATVFKAYQPSMDRYVAIKILPRHLSEDQTFVARFNQEARTLARLEHLHILPVHDYGEQDGLTYLVMRYVEAGTLKDLITREGPPELKEVARILDQVGRALDYAHSHGVLHRDIKPSNILIDKGRDTFLTDFGIAKLVAETAKYTATGAIIGTPAYMSPEQGLGEAVDARCDIYALGVLLYEMITGRVPYEAETPLAVVLKHINDPLPMPRHVRPDLPEAVERVILKAMAKAPADRWQTPREMVDALNRAVAGMPTEAAVAEPPAQGLESTVLRAHAAPDAGPAEPLRPGVPAGAAAQVQRPSATPEATARERLAEPGPRPAQAAPSIAARRPPRWLPIAGGAALLVALIAVAVIVLGPRGRDGIPASATQPSATTAASLATATSPVPTGETPAAVVLPTDTVAALPSGGASTAAPHPAGSLPGWTSYSNANLALTLARQGDSVWVGSEGGLVRWDLAAGTYVKLGVADGLASGHINDLLVDEEDVLWVATAAGLSRFDGTTWTTFDQADGLDANWVGALWLDAAGALWAGTAYGDRGLNYYDGEGWGPPPIPAMPVGAPVITALTGDEETGLFVGLDGAGLAHFDGEEWTVQGSKDGLPGDRVLALALADDALWASFDDGLVRFDRATGDWEKAQEITVYAMCATSDGPLWFGTEAGAIRFDPDTGDWQPFEAAPGPFPGGLVTDITEDEDGIWFSTYGAGAIFYDGSQWKSWMTADWVGGNLIDAIRQGRDGSLWFTHPGTGLSRYDPGRDAWQSFAEKDGAFGWPSAPGVDSQGNVWIARDGTLARYDGHGWQAYAVPDLANVSVQAIEIGPGDVQWLRTDVGLMRHDPATDRWTTFGSADHPVLANILALLITRDGTVWAGGEGGLIRYDGSAWSEGETAGDELREVKDMAEAADGSLWLAAEGSLIHLQGGKQYVYRRPDEGYLDRLAIAPDGSVWAGYEGVGRFDPTSNSWQIFTADGLLDMRVTAISVTPDGVVWIGTEGGVSRYVPPGS